MLLRTSAVAIALSLTMAAAATAQPSTPSLDARGTVVNLDAPYNVVVLEDGRMYRITPNTVLLVDNQAVPLSAVRPGSVVVLRSAEAVTLRNGQYVVAAPAAPPPVAVSPAPPPPAVVAAPAAPTVVAPAPVAVTALKRTIYGRVTDVDRDGEVKIQTDTGSFEVRLTPDTVRQIRKGDTVVIDTTFAPPGTQIR
jgi:hypothetical protein